MNLFNRIVISLLLLGFIVVILLLALLPRPAIESARAVLDAAEMGLDSTTQLLGAVIGLLAAVGAFLLLVAELRPPARQSVVVIRVAAGTAELTNESVAQRVKKTAEEIPGVREASPTIRSRGRAVDVFLRLSVDPDVDLPKKSEEVMHAVKAETETKMGVPVKSLKVTVKHGASDRRLVPSDPGAPPKDPFRS